MQPMFQNLASLHAMGSAAEPIIPYDGGST